MFDNDLLRTVKQGITHMPAPPHHVRLPCTLDMINYIVERNTKVGATMSQVMLSTGVYMGFFLCLRSSEYISKTVLPLVDTHQFLSTDVQFVLHDAHHTLVNVIRLDTTNTRTSKRSNSVCCMQRTFEMILVFPSGFQLMTPTVGQSRLFIWCISGQRTRYDLIRILSCHFEYKID